MEWTDQEIAKEVHAFLLTQKTLFTQSHPVPIEFLRMILKERDALKEELKKVSR